jgi:hypothetical protein
MTTVKKFFALGIFMLAGVLAHAQKVTVTKSTELVDGKKCDGYSTELTGSLEEVNTALTKYIKASGQVKLTGAQGFKKNPAPFLALSKAKGDKVAVWIGAERDSAKDVSSETEKLTYDFGVKFYKDKIQADIDQSLRAQEAVAKQQQRLVTENKNLDTDLEFNLKDRTRLEKAIVNNKLDSARLISAIAKNKKSQDSVAVAGEQIKKMVETHKERQRRVN